KISGLAGRLDVPYIYLRLAMARVFVARPAEKSRLTQRPSFAVWQVETLKPTILLASTNSWLSPVRIAGTFAGLGCRVHAICPPRNALTVSSAVRRTYLYRSFRPLSSIDAAIEAADPDLVVPCDDLATAH